MDSEDHRSQTSSHGDFEKDGAHTNLYKPTDLEHAILEKQLAVAPVKASYWILYRYATRADLLIMFACSITAIGAGAILPLMTIVWGSFAASFGSFSSESDISHFRHEVSHMASYFVYLGIASFVFTYISTVGFIYTGEHITQQSREKYLAAVLRQNIAFFDKLGAGEVTICITADMNAVQAGISQKVSLTLTGLAMFVTGLIVGFVKNWKLTFILFCVVIAMVLAMGGCSRFMVKYMKLSQQSSGQGATRAEEVFSSIRNATALGSQERLAVDYALAFWEGSRFLVKGDTGMGDILTVLLSVMMGSVSLGQITPHFQAFGVAKATAGPIFSVIDRVNPDGSETGKTLRELQGAIELRSVRHIYPSRPEVVVLNNIDLSIPAGKITALVGASGSGKSTIVGLLERFYRPVGGRILLDGQDIQELDLKWLRTQMALVSQEPVLFGTSIFENIAHGLIGTQNEHLSDEKKMELVIEAAKMANAHDFVSLLPEGYMTSVGERGFLMSGGQKQRIAIARAVISDPKILLLDESTSALDTKSEGVVQAALDKASKGRTTIVIAHRLSTIKGADNIVVMADGSIVEQGTHKELINHAGAYLQLVEAQKVAEDHNKTDDADETHSDHDSTTKAEHSELIHTDSGPLARATTNKSIATLEAGISSEEFHYSLWTLIKFIWHFNKPEKWIMLFGLICSILAGSTVPVQAVYVGKEISSLSLPPSEYHTLRHNVNFWSLMFFVSSIVIFLAYTFQGAFFAHCSERLIFRARSKAIRCILRQDIAFFDRPENTSGALVSILSSDVTHLAGMSGTVLGSILATFTTIVEALCLSCGINWKLGLVTGTSIPVLLACGYVRFGALAKFDLRAQKAYKESASYACEATAAIRTIASLTREDEVWEHYHSMLVTQTSNSLRSVLKSSLLYAASQAGMYLASALGFWYGGQLISRGEISTEGFFICLIAIIFGAQSAGGIFSHAPDMGKSKQAAEGLKKLFDRVPEIDTWSGEGEKVTDVKGVIEFRNVYFRYPTRPGQAVLKGLDLRFEPGQNVALVGASGCGKSTIISLLERFYDPTHGQIFLDGKNISILNLKDYRSQIALVSQEPVLYSGTIKENIIAGNENVVDDEAVFQACRDANIWDFISSLPNGLSTLVGSKGVMLSGGQKQRVAIARALIRNPKILLLDEATSALDSTSEVAVQVALNQAAKGRTTISIAHRLSTIRNADVIFVIEAGRVVERGCHDGLMEERGRYWEMVGMQGLKGREG